MCSNLKVLMIRFGGGCDDILRKNSNFMCKEEVLIYLSDVMGILLIKFGTP